ncbi:MAG: hypothetical protein EAY79_08005 [Runella slithyformis]|nr:MAG: hypothetical protein EAY79_08005 [Runella slithyformis]TAE99281.1 MAG: hypothetical protein EAZ80_05215 [Runella slithyformis]TAF48743.1 MAG: hypothetical protein EAZ63_04145 [Runella slithyformis]
MKKLLNFFMLRHEASKCRYVSDASCLSMKKNTFYCSSCTRFCLQHFTNFGVKLQSNKTVLLT